MNRQDRLWAYQALTDAEIAANNVLFIFPIERMAISQHTQAHIDRLKEAAFFAAAFAWNAVYTPLSIDKERSAKDASLNLDAGMQAFGDALAGVDPDLITLERKNYDLTREIIQYRRADYESLSKRYIEAFEGKDFNEAEVTKGLQLPDEAGLKAMYAAFFKEKSFVFILPITLEETARKLQLSFEGIYDTERAALVLASALTFRNGPADRCRYCNRTFEGPDATPQSSHRGVCETCNEAYQSAVKAYIDAIDRKDSSNL